MRNIYHVIEEMLKYIPTSEETFRAELENLKTSVQYTAPELIGFRWKCGAEILETYIDENTTEEWRKKVINIWMGKLN